MGSCLNMTHFENHKIQKYIRSLGLVDGFFEQRR